MKQYYRKLPHIQPIEAVFFITARLHGSLPIAVLEQIREQREQEIKRLSANPEQDRIDRKKRDFARYENYLNNPKNGPYWLSDPEVAQLLTEAFHYRDNKQYELVAFCVMSNHYHLLIDTRKLGHEKWPLHRIMQPLHSHVALKANEHLNRASTFWHDEYYDHIIRDDAELRRVIEYTLNNPVKAGLVDEWQQWPHSYVNEVYW